MCGSRTKPGRGLLLDRTQSRSAGAFRADDLEPRSGLDANLCKINFTRHQKPSPSEMARYRYHRRLPLFAIDIDSNDGKNGAQNFQFLETDKAAMNLHRAARDRKSV